MSISSVTLNTSTLPPDQSNTFICCNASKIQRYAYYFFSSLSFMGGSYLITTSLLGTITPLFGIGSIPLYLLSYYLGKEGYGIWDYSNPLELQILRQKALEIPLLQFAGKQGWQNVFQYSLLTPENFNIAFLHQAQTLDTNQLLQMHKQATQGLNFARQRLSNLLPPFVIPDLGAFQNRFHQETRTVTCDQILVKYNIEDLLQHHFITNGEAQILRQLKSEYDQAVRECRIQINHIDDSFRHQTAGVRLGVNAARIIGHEALLHNQQTDLNTIRKHIGLEILSQGAYHYLTAAQRGEREQALFFHQGQLQQKIDAINIRYQNFCRQNAIL